ncbi:PilC/PilY family type IV pilus protein [Shewanella gelidii]|uniref:Type IV pili system adhesin PilY n=1 Tax=Shewanella gelidii TaxID=1642821 RepID=A0A917JJ21_9GAMM|nr:PilC/PilY family type IV pilus protein [Shewanella gelidii]MCL1097039.1 VWA domain-containing protein [Shewanella gelidii]GGI72075.1 type IV pili system adhesin PilY [Shewanella gelidii]
MIRKLISSVLAMSVVLSTATVSVADDTELYVYESSGRSNERPKVLVIFDTSGSMTTTQDVFPFYDNSVDLKSNGSDVRGQVKLYYSFSGDPVPTLDSQQFFKYKFNGCETSKSFLKSYGIFGGFFRHYAFTDGDGSWQELPKGNRNGVKYIDCYEDFKSTEHLMYGNGKIVGTNTGIPDGFPIDGLGNESAPEPYTSISSGADESDRDAALDKAKLTQFGIGEAVTVYTEGYVTAYHEADTDNKVSKSRMDIAKQVMTETILSTPNVDFGLMAFNLNRWWDSNYGGHITERHGGRIVSKVNVANPDNRRALLELIDDLVAEGATPLCESLYEGYLYFAGKQPKYLYEHERVSPDADDTAVSIVDGGERYISPFAESKCLHEANIIVITDGKPTNDEEALNVVPSLPYYDSSLLATVPGENDNPMPALARIMNHESFDVYPTDTDNQQNVKTYTIGFSAGADDAKEVLSMTAEHGGGKYFTANDPRELQSALQQIVIDINDVDSSFTSPSIASNNFDRTRSFDSVYYGMFLPDPGPSWSGNLKKFKINNDGELLDRDGDPALDKKGNILSGACSYWTPSALCTTDAATGKKSGDGPRVNQGGAAHAMRTRGEARVLYSDIGSSGGLTSLTLANAQSKAGSQNLLGGHMGLDTATLEDAFDWIAGQDIEKGDGSMRLNIMGDPLHSKPLAINYGTKTEPDIRILIGTNHGFLHMFQDKASSNQIEENWAIMPYELLPNVRPLMENIRSGVHSVYGLDSSPVAYVKSGAGGVEKAWVFIGMRRGGSAYYAFDITDPDAPKLMWRKSAESTGMSEMGQSWSEPVVTKIPGWPVGNTSVGNASPVLIFGAGYQPASKDSEGLGSDDSKGRGVFILDAETGALVHQFGAGSSGIYTKMAGITDSIPNSVAVLDSDSDGLSDRIYASDTGANVWRLDMPSGYVNDATKPWTSFKFAQLGGSSLADDRRFFAEPAVAQTIMSISSEVTVTVDGESTTTVTSQNVPYDAVAIGSGNRPHPTGIKRQDHFYMLQDRNVTSRSFTGKSGEEIPAPLQKSNLDDVTTPPMNDQQAKIAFGTKRGWFYSFAESGQKSLSAAIIVSGKVHFTSFVPGTEEIINSCLKPGGGRLHSYGLHRGFRIYEQEYVETGPNIPDTPTIFFSDPDSNGAMYFSAMPDDVRKIKPVPDDGCDPDDHKCLGGGVGVNKIYYHIAE